MSRTRNQINYREWKRKNYLKNREKELERKRKYYSTPEGKIAQKNSWKNAWKKSKHKILARQAVRKAIKSGKIKKQPCEKCGDTKTDAHHEDYSKRLDVKWLCKKHHYELHRKPRKTEDGTYNW